MWQLHDDTRRQRRLSQHAFRSAVLATAFVRERALHPTLHETTLAYGAIGGNISRTSLTVWLLETADHHSFRPNIVFLALHFLDRALAKLPVSYAEARKVAAACLLIAVKLDAVGGDAMSLPTFHEVPDVHVVEMGVLRVLKWDLLFPTENTFLEVFCDRFLIPPSSVLKATEHLLHMVSHLDCRAFYPSTLAYVSLLLLERDRLLPEACKQLIVEDLKDDATSAATVVNALRKFAHCCVDVGRLPFAPDITTGSSEDDYPSSTTAYPSSDLTSGSMTGSSQEGWAHVRGSQGI